MLEEVKLLQLVCQRLDKIFVPYMLTGSLAANLYATPRMTRDLDIVLELGLFEIDKFCSQFENDFYFSKNTIAEAIDRQSMFNIIHNNSVFKVDCIIRKNSIYRTTEFQRKKQIELNGIPIWVVAPEDLIISKLFWAKDSGSELQIKDIKNLLAALKNLDDVYLKTWIQKLDLNSIYQKATG